MKIWKMATLGAMVLCLTVVPAYAQLWGRPKVAEKLGLTEEQTKQLEANAVEHQKEAIRRNSQAKVLELELRQLWKAETPDEAKILAKVKELAKVRQEQMVARTEHRLDMHRILTPEQRQQVRQGVARGIAQRRFGEAGIRGRRQPAPGRAPAGQGALRRGPVGPRPGNGSLLPYAAGMVSPWPTAGAGPAHRSRPPGATGRISRTRPRTRSETATETGPETRTRPPDVGNLEQGGRAFRKPPAGLG